MKILVFWSYILKDLHYDLLQNFLTIVGLAIMVLSYLLTASLSEAFHKFQDQPGVASYNLALLSADTIDPMQGSVSQVALDQAVLAIQTAFGDDSVRRAAPIIFRTLRVAVGTETFSMQIFAVDPQDMGDVYNLTLMEGRYPEGNLELAASQEAFELAGWKLGQQIDFYGQKFDLVGKVHYETGKIASLWLTYTAGENLFGTQRGFQIGLIQISGKLDPESVRAYLETVPGIRPTYAVYLEQDLYNRFTEAVQDILKFSIVMDVLALGVISFGIFNATSLTLTERSREIALLRVAGFTTRNIHTILFGRTFLQTLVAFLLGWGLAAWVIQNHLSSSFSMHGVYVRISISAINLLLGMVLTTLFVWFGVFLTSFNLNRHSLVSLLVE